MSVAKSLRTASRKVLREHIVEGYAVDPKAIEGFAYRGTSLGLPAFVERLTWKTFLKTFYRDPGSGRLVGWNVRLEQDGLDARSRPRLDERGCPVCVWNYEVIAKGTVPMPRGFDRGLVIDYSCAKNPTFDTVRLMKDPLVALSPDSCDELIGVSYVVLGGVCIETPTYFTLEREGPIDYVPPSVG